ncbi:MAG: hypothetical protein K1000chlam2_00648 [Chlamydiae bacterium]|nr:hypothetical protein [Chlamydiota bacterium]
MKTKGIRISDLKEGKCIPLSEVLANIPHASQLNWALLWFDVTPTEKEGKLLTELQKKVKESEEGLSYTFESLAELSKKIFQEIEVLIVGCKNKENVRRYKDDQEMYETCDIVIEMIDGGFWEIFSKDISWIDQLAEKYEEVEFLTSDFQKKASNN